MLGHPEFSQPGKVKGEGGEADVWGQKTGSCRGAGGRGGVLLFPTPTPVRLTSREAEDTEEESLVSTCLRVIPTYLLAADFAGLGMEPTWEPDTLAPCPEADVANGGGGGWDQGLPDSTPPPRPSSLLSCRKGKEEADGGESTPCR